jgi:hypothetical protein
VTPVDSSVTFSARKLAQQLAALQGAPTLQPDAAGFGPAALCLRCVLDDALSRLPPQQALKQQATVTAEQLAAADAALSSRFMQLACPPLQLFCTQLHVRLQSFLKSS